MQSLNWGIIGPGNIAHDFARDLQLIKPAQRIVAALGRDREATEGFCKEFSVPGIYTDIDAFIGHAALDIVYIATPHPQHYEQALACLENNIHVLVEKPMALNARQSKELIAASERNNRFLMEGMWIRFLPSIQKLMSLLKENAIGQVISVNASMGYKAPRDDRNRYYNPELGGGSLMDLGIYPVFLTHLLLGSPQEIKAIGSLTDKGVDEFTAALLNYTSGRHAMVRSTLISQSDAPAEIAGETGLIRILNPWFEKSIAIELIPYDKEKQVFPCEWEGHGLQFEAEEALRCISGNHIESEFFSHAFSRELSETMDEIKRQVNINYKQLEAI